MVKCDFDEAERVVLVVEDHDDSREMLKVLLGILGYRVFEATDGERAIEMAQTFRPDLILLDMKIPVLDGLTVARVARSSGLSRGSGTCDCDQPRTVRFAMFFPTIAKLIARQAQKLCSLRLIAVAFGQGLLHQRGFQLAK